LGPIVQPASAANITPEPSNAKKWRRELIVSDIVPHKIKGVRRKEFALFKALIISGKWDGG
jgi:hypothetical protein